MDLTWYGSLNKPLFTPPSWVFAPVWTILYICMAISAFLVLRHGFKKEKVKRALGIFAVQLVLNLIWSPVFFGLHQTLLAFLIIVFMWYFIYKTIKAFYGIDKIASYLLYPYLAWVSIASVLNLSVVLLNR